ncbi:MAG: ABC-ATPase domain-containing protein [Jaaginema sp. PMC 1079.18]|nr:ABC-ATPase domain-containing protein [Jaaginema sp. PMC 1080.18]MEC4851774.1 ABC-ATPase domain-containing protein [Jaaginema sp. PMC 1079.18]MEC4864516.1 ABC-ATPase domain-containing protein [Jaaginema sp. PMC 1078.18]
MTSQNQLRSHLLDLDNRNYKAYKDIQGCYEFDNFSLSIDRVQGDPFAAPSQLRVFVPPEVAQFPPQLYQSTSRRIALEDYLTRQFSKVARQLSERRGTGKSGSIAIARVGQEILQRTTILLQDGQVEARFTVGLPARGRSILGRQAAIMLCEVIPEIVETALIFAALDAAKIQTWVETNEDADFLRSELKKQNLVAFVANNAVLPRNSGVDDRPLADNAVPFQSPPELEVSFNCPNGGEIRGMGIPPGITLIVGGGYHGKSTLLRSIEVGVYNHIPGDGREFVITNPDAVKIRAEDGRSIVGTNISPFINHLPQNRSTEKFSTTNASGSTSQAANIIEALEAGAQVLLLDEDTSATNFMIRDRRMQQLIAKEKEPITPFIDKIPQLYSEYGVSTILVMGGSGDYFDVADTVIALDNFSPYEVTAKAKEIANEYRSDRAPEGGSSFGDITPRIPKPDGIDPSQGKKAVKLKVRDVDEVRFGSEDIDLSAVEQIVDPNQLRAIASALVYAKTAYIDSKRPLPDILDLVMADIISQGLDVLSRYPEGNFAQFRRFELAAALNRLRTLDVV